jgi:NAD(P)-dependent dehydrogenase (short-subunit alcohol dehydrogenase family)
MAGTERPAAIVTGASSGIGLAIAHVLGQEGYAMTALARQPEKLDAAVAELRGAGYEVHPFAANVVHEEAIKAAADSHHDRFGRLDLLVNNAGFAIGGPFEETQTKFLDLQYQVDLRAVLLFTLHCLPMLRETARREGSALVVNTASYSGKVGQPVLSVYSALKHGVVGLTESLNAELGPEGIKFTALCPGIVATKLGEWYEKDVPREQMLLTTDVAEGVRFLLRVSSQCVIPEIQYLRPGRVP